MGTKDSVEMEPAFSHTFCALEIELNVQMWVGDLLKLPFTRIQNVRVP